MNCLIFSQAIYFIINLLIPTPFLFFSFLFCKIYLAISKLRAIKRGIFHLMIHFLYSHTARTETGQRQEPLPSLLHRCQAVLYCFPRSSAENWSTSGAAGTRSWAPMGCQHGRAAFLTTRHWLSHLSFFIQPANHLFPQYIFPSIINFGWWGNVTINSSLLILLFAILQNILLSLLLLLFSIIYFL